MELPMDTEDLQIAKTYTIVPRANMKEAELTLQELQQEASIRFEVTVSIGSFTLTDAVTSLSQEAFKNILRRKVDEVMNEFTHDKWDRLLYVYTEAEKRNRESDERAWNQEKRENDK